MSGFQRAACRRRARACATKEGDIPDSERCLQSDHPSPTKRSALTTKTEGLRMLWLIHKSGVVEPLEARLNGLVDSTSERRLLGPRPGQRSRVTVTTMLLAILLCALCERSYRRTDLLRVLTGLHVDVARTVGLVDADGAFVVKHYKTVLRQLVRMESVLREGWTVVENEGQPDEVRVRHDLQWFVRSLLRASIPERVLADVRHVAVDATNINSWANFLPGVGKKDVKKEPVAARQKQVVAEDSDAVPEPDLEKFWRAAKKKKPDLEFGPDGRPLYTADRDVRVGHRSANSEGSAGFFLGFDLNALVIAPTVKSNGSRNTVTLEKLPPYVVAMDLSPALTNCGPIASRLVMEAREICPDIEDVTGDRGYSTKREYARPLHQHDLNVFMDYRSDTLALPKRTTIGKHKHPVCIHAGTILSEQTPTELLVLPDPPADLVTPEERAEWRNSWYADRAKLWGWSAKSHFGDGRIQLRSPSGAGRAAAKRATAASDSFKAPYRPSKDSPTVTALLDELDTWQRLTFGTSAWARAYYAGRSAVENLFSRLKENQALASGTCQALGLAANTIAVLARVVIYNLHKAAVEDDRDDGDEDSGDQASSGDSPLPPDPRLGPDGEPAALRAPP